MRAQFQFASKPFAHQQAEFDTVKERQAFGRLWEMGTGKTRATLDEAAWHYAQGNVDALLVVAPNGVHRNWISDEIPKHLHRSVERDCHVYNTSQASTKGHERACEQCIRSEGLAVLAMSYDGFATGRGKAFAKRFLTKRKCMFVADESANIKNPAAQRTKILLAASKYAPVRRILTGTPVDNGPFDVYSQIKFLDEDFWKTYGLDNYTLFKQYFGIFRPCQTAAGQRFDQLVAYRNVERLNEMISGITSRVTKDDVLDLPPKLYSRRYFEMTPLQARVYNDLKRDCIAYLDGESVDATDEDLSAAEQLLVDMADDERPTVTATLAIVRMMRLQQITCGYVSPEAGEPEVLLDTKNPRLECLSEVIEELAHPAIIWARFSKDVDLIVERFKDRAVRYDGQVDTRGRIEALDKFHGGQANLFVAKTSTAGEGLTLTEARTVIYYSNDFRLSKRLQSEDRAHRIGQEHPVEYIDIMCAGTIDQNIVDALMSKFDIARRITGDAFRMWLGACAT